MVGVQGDGLAIPLHLFTDESIGRFQEAIRGLFLGTQDWMLTKRCLKHFLQRTSEPDFALVAGSRNLKPETANINTRHRAGCLYWLASVFAHSFDVTSWTSFANAPLGRLGAGRTSFRLR